MKINKLNYESFALEYLEGALSIEEMEAMERFLLKHPAIKTELEGMKEFIVLTPEPIVFNNKKQLLKQTSKDKVVWLNPVLRWSVAASILLAVTILFFFKNTTIDSTIASATPDEVIDSSSIQSVLPNESEVEQEILVIDNQVTLEVGSQEAVASNETPIKRQFKQLSKTSANKKGREKYPTIPYESQIVVTTTNSSAVTSEEEEIRPLAIANQTTPLSQPAKETIQIATLTARDIVLLEVPKEIDGNAINHISTTRNTAIAKTPERRTLKSLIGKLPGNGVKISIIPSFFTD